MATKNETTVSLLRAISCLQTNPKLKPKAYPYNLKSLLWKTLTSYSSCFMCMKLVAILKYVLPIRFVVTIYLAWTKLMQYIKLLNVTKTVA
jgi:hypothetical protein